MKTEANILENLKGQNPFRVPEGYFNGLTDSIMSKIPDEVPHAEAKIISLTERIRPLMYLAAFFVGAVFLFKVVLYPALTDRAAQTDETAQQATMSESEDEEYLEYLQQHYYNYNNMLTVSLENME